MTLRLFLLVPLLAMVTSEDDFLYDLSPHPDYKMWWKFDDEHITVKVKANTTGK